MTDLPITLEERPYPEAGDYVRAIRMCDGGETVTDGTTPTLCSYCSSGVCIAAGQACEVPEA